MAKLNSPMTQLRLALVRWIDPRPPVDEAWCMGCALLDGANVAIPYDQLSAHLDAHGGHPGAHMSIRGTGKIPPRSTAP